MSGKTTLLGYLCHVLITGHDKGVIVSPKQFIFCKLVHRIRKSEKSMFDGHLPHFVMSTRRQSKLSTLCEILTSPTKKNSVPSVKF